MSLSQLVESYKFWDVVTLWARERLEYEEIVARALARAVICDGLMLNRIDMRWVKRNKEQLEFKGYPYVGYCPIPGGETMVLRADALEHLLSIVRKAETPSRDALSKEFTFKEDFKKWLVWSEQPFPSFWFGEEKADAEA